MFEGSQWDGGMKAFWGILSQMGCENVLAFEGTVKICTIMEYFNLPPSYNCWPLPKIAWVLWPLAIVHVLRQDRYTFAWCDIITRTSEYLIRLGITHELCLCRDISWVWRTSEITIHKNNSPDRSTIEHVLFLFHINHNKITQLDIEQRTHNRKGS